MMIRTRPDGHTELRVRDWVLVGLGTFLIPPIVGLLVGNLLNNVDSTGAPFSPIAALAGFLMAQAVAPVVSIIAVPFGLLTGAYLLKRGFAGWLVALLLPAAIVGLVVLAYSLTDTGYQPLSYLAPAAVFAASAGLHGIVAWLILRFLRPSALIAGQA